MTTPYTPTPFIQMTAVPQTPTPATRGRGAKRGRKPRGAILTSGPASHQANATPATGAQFTPVQWPSPTVPASTPATVSAVVPAPASTSQSIADGSTAGLNVAASDTGDEAGPSTVPLGGVNLTTAASSTAGVGVPRSGAGVGDEDGEEDELLPAMADDDYSAQLLWQSESKDNLKCVISILRVSIGFSSDL